MQLESRVMNSLMRLPGNPVSRLCLGVKNHTLDSYEKSIGFLFSAIEF